MRSERTGLTQFYRTCIKIDRGSQFLFKLLSLIEPVNMDGAIGNQFPPPSLGIWVGTIKTELSLDSALR